MRILITGICGFVGSTLALGLREGWPDWEVAGIDNLIRPGSETNRVRLKQQGVRVMHGDLRNASDLEALRPCDWIIDAAANPSVLAGVDGRTSSRQLIEHNLVGTVNLLELCKQWRAGMLMLSTSRVYSIEGLAGLPVEARDRAFQLKTEAALPPGVSEAGIAESFSTAAPVSLYGASKLASEALVLEYGAAFDFPVWINRCGVLAGAGQFGRADQGIFAYWINSHLRRAALRYIGFGGAGHQVRDCLHPRDMLGLLCKQLTTDGKSARPRLMNVSGGRRSARSLRQLTDWCNERFGRREVAGDPAPRPFDLPWVVLDSELAQRTWDWRPLTAPEAIFEEIAAHAQTHGDWLQVSAPQ